MDRDELVELYYAKYDKVFASLNRLKQMSISNPDDPGIPQLIADISQLEAEAKEINGQLEKLRPKDQNPFDLDNYDGMSPF